jgi:hypothetical protein
MNNEVIQGQKRFATMFSDESSLTTALKKYHDLMLELHNLISDSTLSEKDFITLNTNFKNRDLNLLFRQSATNSNKIEILKFLLNNASILNVNIYEKGKKSQKDAHDVAVEFSNNLAIAELSPHWLSKQINTEFKI